MPAYVVQRLLEECEARAKMVLLDCCFSGMFTKRPTASFAGSVSFEAGNYEHQRAGFMLNVPMMVGPKLAPST